MFEIPCVIFAGGKSSRMGEDKALLSFGEFSTLSEFQFTKLQKIFTDVYISCKDKNKFSFVKKYAKKHFIEDLETNEIYAPTLGFISTFSALECEKFFAISVDTPFISNETIKTLIQEDNEDFDATIATLNTKVQPMCGIYHRSLLKSFENMYESNTHKLNHLLQKSHTNYIDFFNEDEFLNLNNPQEYQKALELLCTKN